MRICYIKQAEKVDEYINYTSKIKLNSIKKIVMNFKKTCNNITIKPIGDGVIFYLPNKIKDGIKVANKVLKELKYYNIKNIVIEKKLQDKNFRNKLYEENVNILDGRWLFNYLLIDILEYIVKAKQEDLESQEVSILVNDLNEINLSNIYELALKVKRINIITNDINKLKNIESKLYEEKGIMITVANNKRKSLAKAKIILNIDFPEELINKYNINKKSIIVNFEEKIKINAKNFSGININYYDVEVNEAIMKKYIQNEIYASFDKNILYESNIYDKNRYQIIREKIKKDGVVISGLIGNNGIINEKEFKQNVMQM